MTHFNAVALALALLGAHAWSVRAAIPEPDLIYYGTVRVSGALQTSADDTTVELRRSGVPIASAAIQNIGAADHYYILRIGLESTMGGGPSSGIAQLGESLTLALVSVGQALDLEVAAVTLGSRGRVTRHDLDTATAGDFDGDGTPDYLDNCYLANAGQADADGNGIGDACEGLVNPGLLYQTVGDPGNPADPATGKGAVADEFDISDAEVTNADYVEFLNAVAASDPNGLYSDAMTTDPRGGILRSGAPGSFGYTVKPNMADKPVNFVSWLDAARYLNWLENGSQSGAPGVASLESGAFDLSVTDPGSMAALDPGSTHSLPTEEEWYKAAYYDPTRGGSGYWAYPTRTDVPPIAATANGVGDVSNPGVDVANFDSAAIWNGQTGNLTTVGSAGAPSYYGTSDQGGNVREWLANDSEITPDGLQRVARGGDYQSIHLLLSSTADSPDREDVLAAPDTETADLGFRVVVVPEPGVLVQLLPGIALLAGLRRRRLRADGPGR